MQTTYKDELYSFLNKIKQRSKNYIGYPAATDFDYSELYPLLEYTLNNIGDPYIASTDMQTKGFEQDVIKFFAELFHAPANNHWGYVTNGGSEGNLYALYLARELFSNGMVYYSEATHYSIQKNVHLLGMDSIVVRSQHSGEMDYDDLMETIQLHRHRPVIILANIGTTMTEAKDDVPKIKEILKAYAIKSSYIHCDAALAGTYLSLMQKGNFDFRHGADSIAISGHKFIGSPITCGLVLVKRSYKDRIGRSVSYIGTLDTTVSGSRNGITRVFLWYAIKKYGKEGLLNRAKIALHLAEYTVDGLNTIKVPAWRNEDALTVVFPKPSQWICHKWQLASENDLSHLICMPGINKAQIDAFIADMKNNFESPELMCDFNHTMN